MEIINRLIGNYLRCYCTFKQDNWDKLLYSAEFSNNSARVDAMDMTSFEADLGWQPKSPLDLLANYTQDHLQTVTDFKEHLEESFRVATVAHRLAQARQSAYNSNKYTPPSCEVGDEVYLSKKRFTDSSSAARLSQKLSVRRVGLFKALQVINKKSRQTGSARDYVYSSDSARRAHSSRT